MKKLFSKPNLFYLSAFCKKLTASGMKNSIRKSVLIVMLFTLVKLLSAEGLLTNNFQSSQFVRMLSRNATTEIDAVYYNPAGLIYMKDGWHFSIDNLFSLKSKSVESGFPLLNNGYYKGSEKFNFFPSFFAVYKKNDWAFSFGLGQTGGSGLTDFQSGLPSFEIPVSKVVPQLADLSQIDSEWDVTGYDANVSFYGSSVLYGIQFGASYRVNKILSVYGGVRYLPAKNSYDGSISNVMLRLARQPEMVSAPDWMRQTSEQITNVKIPETNEAAKRLNQAVKDIQPIVKYNGNNTLTEIENAGIISADERQQMEEGLLVLNYTQEEIDNMDMATIQSNYAAGADYYEELAENELPGTAKELKTSASNLEDKKINIVQTGAGITPMFGLDVIPAKNLIIALKYELGTYLQLVNDTKADDLGLFPDKGKEKNNIPSFAAIGVGYKHANWLETQLSCNLYFNKGVDWGYNSRDAAVWRDVNIGKIRMREIKRVGLELGLGFQFNTGKNLSLSIGGLYSDPGVDESFQSDFNYANSSFSAGTGFQYKISNHLRLNAGISNSFYQEVVVRFTDPTFKPYFDTLRRSALNIAAGFSYGVF